MSKNRVMIFPMRFSGGEEYFFLKEKEYTNHPKSDSVFRQAKMKEYVSSLDDDHAYRIASLFGVENDDAGVKTLAAIGQIILDSGYSDEDGLLKESVDGKIWEDLLDDIYTALSSSEWVKFIPQLLDYYKDKEGPRCHIKTEEPEDFIYKAYGISHLPLYSGDWFQDAWCKALINDFTEEGDEVILALHCRSDVKGYETVGYNHPMPQLSQSLSGEMKREISVHVFNHMRPSSYIKEALLSSDPLPVLWERIESHKNNE